jgi:hypothetical protein
LCTPIALDKSRIKVSIDQCESALMAVREFVDEQGKSWRVWSILPESIQPLTRAEDYLEDRYRLGWLVFETSDQKRRLCPFPHNWESVDELALRSLLRESEAVRARRPSDENVDRQ